MTYTPPTPWADFSTGGTNLSAANLNLRDSNVADHQTRLLAVESVTAGTPAAVSASNTAAQNSTAINAAITTAAASATSNIVTIPKGNYDHQGFTFPTAGKVTVRGAGAGATVLRNTHATNSSVTLRGTSGGPYCPNSGLADLTLTADTRRASQIALDVQLAHFFTVQRVAIDTHGYGVQHGSSWDSTYTDVKVSGCASGWFFPTPPFTSSSPMTLLNCSAVGCDTAAYITDGVESLTWVGGDFSGSGYGLFVLGAQSRGLRFESINFEGMTTGECVTIGDATNSPAAVTFDGCRFWKTGTPNVRAVRHTRGSGVSFNGCHFNGFTTAILQDATAAALTYSGCTTGSVTTFLTDATGLARVVSPVRRTAARRHSTADVVVTPPVDFSLVPIALAGTTLNYALDLTTNANKITATTAGPHFVAAGVSFSGGDPGPRVLSITVNGTSVREYGPGSGATTLLVNGSDILDLALGDQVGMSVYVGGTGVGPTVQGSFPKQTGLAVGLIGGA